MLGTSRAEKWHILKKSVARGKARKKAKTMPRIGIDDKAFRIGHNYITLIYDLDNSTVEAIADGKSTDSAVEASVEVLASSRHERARKFSGVPALIMKNFGFLYRAITRKLSRRPEEFINCRIWNARIGLPTEALRISEFNDSSLLRPAIQELLELGGSIVPAPGTISPRDAVYLAPRRSLCREITCAVYPNASVDLDARAILTDQGEIVPECFQPDLSPDEPTVYQTEFTALLHNQPVRICDSRWPGFRHQLDGTVGVNTSLRYDSVQDEVAAVIAPWDRVHGHWLLDVICRLWVLAQAGLQDLPLVCAPSHQYQWDMLELAGYPRSRVYPPWQGRRQFSRVFVPGRMARMYDYVRPEVFTFFDQLTEPVAAAPAKYPERIWLMRGGAPTKRALSNIESVERLFSSRGFHLVDPASLSIEDEINLFRNARIVACEAGSATLNCVFCRPQTNFLVLGHPYAMVTAAALLNLSRHRNFNVRLLVGEYVEPPPNNAGDKERMDRSWTVDLATVELQVDKLTMTIATQGLATE